MNQVDSLKKIVQLSEEMLVAARSYRWNEVVTIEARESQLIGEIALQSALFTSDVDDIRNAIQLILNNHTAISAIAEPLHQDLRILLESFPEPPGTNK